MSSTARPMPPASGEEPDAERDGTSQQNLHAQDHPRAEGEPDEPPTAEAADDEIDPLWSYRPDAWHHQDADLIGYRVEATDGRVGSVASAVETEGAARLDVKTGPWIFGREVTVPAGTVKAIDRVHRVVRLAQPRAVVRATPAYDAAVHGTFDAYRRSVTTYYAFVASHHLAA
ncbi:hypothetical protein ABIA32_005944 [Streptacidiphilus sp. MAP12-20]|uniref:hypothetical protein n=1 Tax=Streptacidiphilus sp. MAP12-20 TaxID=3156299 RepID=UPI0035172110